MLRRTAAAALVLLLSVLPASAGTVREIARIAGEEQLVLRGVGIVYGLNGTGDSGKDLLVARPLAEALKANGIEVPSLDELGRSRAAALVMISAQIPPGGALTGDQFPVTVAALHSATSLVGGELYIAPIMGPIRGSGLYGFAQGRVVVQDADNPTTGRIDGGLRMTRDVVTTGPITGSFDLILKPEFAGWGVVDLVSAEINQQYHLTTRRLDEIVAEPASDRIIRVRIPENERQRPAGFIADVLATEVRSAMRRLPARVVCDTQTGAILITGDVRVSPVAITHKHLSISTVFPVVPPTPAEPRIQESRWVGVETEATEAESTRLQDLLDAMDRLDVDVGDQIQILRMLHSAGKLHGELIINGAGQ